MSLYNYYKSNGAIVTYKQTSNPTGASIGDIWSDTSQVPVLTKVLTAVGPDVWTTLGSGGGGGYTGSQGIQGVIGYTGSQGPAGAGFTGSASTIAGPIGYTGSQGTNGTNGFTGSQGPAGAGFTGSQGTQGVIGYTGSASTVVGYTGSVGTNGGIGFTGSQGTSGGIGFTGSASTVVGYTGSQGPAGAGFTGSQGTSGGIGFTGSQGPAGAGFTGSQGTAGVIGFTGSQGPAGAGFTGSQGIQGVIGFTGSQGTSGGIGFTGSASTVVGYTGSQGPAGAGFTGSQGTVGGIGFTGSASTVIGYTGSVGPAGAGFTGSQGAVGFTGSAGGGGGGIPGGATTQVQYNNLGAFAGSANFTYATDLTLNAGYYLGNIGIAIASTGTARPAEFAHNRGVTTYAPGTIGSWETLRLMNDSTTINAASGFSFLVGGEINAAMVGVRTGTNTGYMEALIANAGSWVVPARFDSTGIKISTAGTGLTLNASTTAVTNPAAGNVTLFGKNLANRVLPASVGPSGMDSALQPAVWRQKVGRWNPPGNATTVPGVDGFTAPTAVGTATARMVATTNLMTRTRRFGYVSAATAASVSGHYVLQAQHTTGDGAGLGGFFYSCRFNMSDAAAVAGARSFVGMSSAIATPTNVEPNTLTNSIGIAQLSTDSTQLYLVYGGSAAQTAIALGTTYAPYNGAVGITTGNLYDLTIYCPPSSNGVVHVMLEKVGTTSVYTTTITPGTPGTQTPANTIFLAHRAWRTNNATALAVGIDIVGVYLESDY